MKWSLSDFLRDRIWTEATPGEGVWGGTEHFRLFGYMKAKTGVNFLPEHLSLKGSAEL